MENMYLISESELIDLLAAYYYANCLDAEGVDNWSWYMINKKEYLGDFDSFEEKLKMNYNIILKQRYKNG